MPYLLLQGDRLQEAAEKPFRTPKAATSLQHHCLT
jgi:hypothetical protein